MMHNKYYACIYFHLQFIRTSKMLSFYSFSASVFTLFYIHLTSRNLQWRSIRNLEVMWAYSCLNDFFVNYYDVLAWCAYITQVRILIKITSTCVLHKVQSRSQQFSGRLIIFFSSVANILTTTYRMPLH